MLILQLVGGVVLLFLGGEALVRGASHLARSWGVSPMVVGLTIVALGTSSPELFASLLAALQGSPGIALGNVIGSNTANIGLILGITALISPIRAKARSIRREVPFMLGVAVLLAVFVFSGGIGRWAGLLLLAIVPFYLRLLLRSKETPEVEEEFSQEYGTPKEQRQSISWIAVIVGLLLLIGGARLLVNGAIGIALEFGVSELVIGLSLVAVGTSLPELFAGVVAALRKEPDLAVGNVVGSNVLNILFILGATALIEPIRVAADRGAIIDVIVMLGFSLVLGPFLMTGMRLGRREGAFLLIAYAGYMFYLFAFSR